ncbi:MAG: hypothetical protein WCT18_04940 [Patescibacteria group bacterium]
MSLIERLSKIGQKSITFRQLLQVLTVFVMLFFVGFLYNSIFYESWDLEGYFSFAGSVLLHIMVFLFVAYFYFDDKKVKNEKNHGFSTVGLMIDLVGLFFLVSLSALPMANVWFSEVGVEKQLKREHPQISEVVKTTSKFWVVAKIAVMENGQPKVYCLDTNIFYDYEFWDCTEKKGGF